MNDYHRAMLPEELIQFLESSDVDKTKARGYWRFFDPEVLDEFVGDKYPELEEGAIPFAVSVFAELLVWEEGQYVTLIDCPYQITKPLCFSFEYFFRDLETPQFVNQHFKMPLFDEAQLSLGLPSANDCYGYFPLLQWGGNAGVEFLQICNWEVHLTMIQED